MKNPYDILGVPETASDEEIKQAYRKLVKKYHPDNYHDSPLEDMAQEKMKEINTAYDEIMRQRNGGSSSSSYSYGSEYGSYRSSDPLFQKIRYALQTGNLTLAEQLLNSCPNHGAEWNYLMGVFCARRGWLNDAIQHFQLAYQMEPGNPEYKHALDQMENMNSRMYRPGNGTFGTELCHDPCTGACCATMLCNLCGVGRFCFLPF